MNKKLNVLIAGPLPPPAGGISIHLSRLNHLLKDDFNIDFIDESTERKASFYNIKSLNLYQYFKRIICTDLFFIHSGNKLLKKFHILSGKLLRKKIVITLHGYGPRRSQPFRFIDSIIYNLADKIILVNSDIEKKLPLSKNKCIVKHAFLPPAMSTEQDLPGYIINRIIKERQQGKIIICANASRLDTHNNQDLYGLDLCVNVIKNMNEKGIHVFLLFTVSSLTNGKERFEEAQEFILKNNLGNSMILINERLSFVKLIDNSDIVLRPTNTDGDALTIREGLYLNKSVLASDVVERPKGTLLFKNRDIADLESKLSDLVNELIQQSDKKNNNQEESISQLKEFYLTLFYSLFQNKKSY